MVNQKNISFTELTSAVEQYFRNLSYTKTRINTYRRSWKLIKQFMDNHSIDFYNAKVEHDFIKSILNKREYSSLSRKEKDSIRAANVLTEFLTTGMIRYRSISKNYEFNGEIGKIITEYLYDKKLKGSSEDTLYNHKLYLYRFLQFLNSQHVVSLTNLENRHILEFVQILGYSSKSTIHCTLCSLRCFLRYLYDNQYLYKNLAYLVPKSSYKKEAKLPSTYTKVEIERLINAIDRSNPKGKRDVAMILLAARLGLRASDICRLKFENIRWEVNTIQLKQTKTHKKIELPLLTEVGNAIIDYLKFARPISDLPYVFLRLTQPYDKLEESTLHSIVSVYFKRAGISNSVNKKHGPHALRHSLASILLEKKTPLPVISEVLGHTNTESTNAYIKIDMDSLKQCALDVLPLQSPYYSEVNRP